MTFTKKFKVFDDELLDRNPELKEVLKPSDHYPELKHIIKNKSCNLPLGSLNTKVIINEGRIIERIYKTPTGKVISRFSKLSKLLLNQAA